MKIIYRPEIDGLRAIAVGSVILYHAQIIIFGYQPFKGGFIGVDIFFVISGYLITIIILKELVMTGYFSFKHFYERRVRRILPALLFVIFASLPFAYIYLLPNSIADFSKSILYSLTFSSNYHFYHTAQEYALAGLKNPFLHTWSLSLEIQYYILFSVVLLITFKYFRKYLINILIIGFIISLGLAEYNIRNYPFANFYFLHTRMWEFLAGSILAYFEITLGHRSKIQTLNLIFPFIGLVLIGHSIMFIDLTYHPSFYTLSSIIGVCLIIWFSDKNEHVTKILSTKLFVNIGLISYSLYLWHYPIFSFFVKTRFVDGSIFSKLIIGTVIFITSIISYNFIERPFRSKKVSFKKISLFFFFKILLITSFCMYIINLQYHPFLTKYESEHKDFELNYNYNNFDNRKNIFIIGNSYADDLLNLFYYNKELNNKYYFYTALADNKGDNFQIYCLLDLLDRGGRIVKTVLFLFFKHNICPQII
jgi:peptidoglycan/LPS O-acetylase OafA/YrhL